MGRPGPRNDPDTPILTGPPFYLEEFEQSYRYIINEYEVQPKDIAIFMPCAVRKPYSSSPSHQLIRMIISQVFDEAQVPYCHLWHLRDRARRARDDVSLCTLQVHARESE